MIYGVCHIGKYGICSLNSSIGGCMSYGSMVYAAFVSSPLFCASGVCHIEICGIYSGIELIRDVCHIKIYGVYSYRHSIDVGLKVYVIYGSMVYAAKL